MNLAAPTIVTHGTDEQRNRFLRPMYTGEEHWCQLFSEPGAGSDFAGLATRAVRDGDEWVVNGQKVWNTMAHLAEWGMLVTRTDPEVPKHRGLTYFLLDMRSPGVEVRPLRQITGEAEFNEVYLTDVRIPDANRVGDEGDGWRVSLTTLMNERTSIGAGTSGPPRRGSGPIGEAVRQWEALPEYRRDPALRDRLMKLWVRAETLRLTNLRAGENRRAGNPGPEGSVAKLAMAELNKDVYELAVDLLGPAGMVDYDFTLPPPRRAERRGLGRAPARASCACGPTPSRAARRRSCATSSASRCWACPASPGSTRTSPGPRSPAADGSPQRPVIPGYTRPVKIAVSIPDPLFEAAEALARRERISRSQLYARGSGAAPRRPGGRRDHRAARRRLRRARLGAGSRASPRRRLPPFANAW